MDFTEPSYQLPNTFTSVTGLGKTNMYCMKMDQRGKNLVSSEGEIEVSEKGMNRADCDPYVQYSNNI